MASTIRNVIILGVFNYILQLQKKGYRRIDQKHMRYLTFLLVLFVLSGCETSSIERPPNVVLVFADDQGYGDTGAYGAFDFETPNLDKLAHEGVRFTHFYSAQAVCSASITDC